MGFLNEIQTHKIRAWKTMNACLMYACIGVCCSATGPALLDLQLQVNASIEEISTILPLRSAGNMFGTFISGVLMSFVDVQIIPPFCLAMIAITAYIIPYCPTLYYLYGALFINGMSSGMINNCCNLWIIHMWGLENGPFLQLLHFSFGLGSFFAPIIVEPFLTPIEISDELTKRMEMQRNFTNLLPSHFNLTNSSDSSLVDVIPIGSSLPPVQLSLHYAYFIIGSLSVLNLISLVATLCYQPSNKPHPTRVVEKAKKKSSKPEVDLVCTESKIEENTCNSRYISSLNKAILVVLGMLFIHFVYGVELSFGNLLPAFVVKSDLHFNKSTASFLTATYWACFTFFRILAVIMISFISNKQILFISMSIVTVANLILLPFANGNPMAMWIGSCLMGFGISSIYPCFLGYLEDLFQVTGAVTSSINIFACIGEFAIPVIVSSHIESYPMLYLWVVFTYGSLALLVLLICTLIERRVKKQRESIK